MTATQIRTYNVLFCDCPECGSRLNLEDATVGRELTHTCGMRAQVTAIFTGFARTDPENAVCLKVLQPAREDDDLATAAPLPSSPIPTIELDLPKVDLATPLVDPELDSNRILDSIDSLTALNRLYLKQNAVPSVMLAAVRVLVNRSEELRTIPKLLLDKTANDAELAAWRLAELQERGEKTKCRVLWSDRGFPRVLVQRQNGSIEIVDELLSARHQ